MKLNFWLLDLSFICQLNTNSEAIYRFVPKNTDYEGQMVKSVQELTLDHPQIALRKDFLKVCLIHSFLIAVSMRCM